MGKIVFVYGGNAYPMSDRFGVGFEKYGEHEQVKEIIFFMPPISEIAIVIGLIGVILFSWYSAIWGDFWNFRHAAWEFFKGGLVWLITLIGVLLLILGISDLRE